MKAVVTSFSYHSVLPSRIVVLRRPHVLNVALGRGKERPVLPRLRRLVFFFSESNLQIFRRRDPSSLGAGIMIDFLSVARVLLPPSGRGEPSLRLSRSSPRRSLRPVPVAQELVLKYTSTPAEAAMVLMKGMKGSRFERV